MEGKENVCNTKECAGRRRSSSTKEKGSKGNKHYDASPSTTSMLSSPIDPELLMVSPLPPPFTNGNDINNQSTPTSKTPPPPPNSEKIQSAFRQCEDTLNAEIDHVKFIASTGGRQGRARSRLYSLDSATSPESDCVGSPVPPTFPPMPNSMRDSLEGSFRSLSRSPMRSRCSVGSNSTKRSPTRAGTTTMTMANINSFPKGSPNKRDSISSSSKTPMTYSSLLGVTPMRAASPLPNKSLLPILTELEEQCDPMEDGSSSSDQRDKEEESIDGQTENKSHSDKRELEAKQPEKEESPKVTTAVEENESQEAKLPVQEIMFRDNYNADDESNSEEEEEVQCDDDPQCIDGDEEVVSNVRPKSPEMPRRRRMIMEEESSDESVIGFSNLNLNDDDGSSKGDESVAVSNKEEDQFNDGKDIVQPSGGKENVPANNNDKAYRRRIIDDEESDDDEESAVDIVRSDDDSNEVEDASQATCESAAEAEPLGDILNGQSKLNLQDNGSESDEEDPSFQVVDDASIKTPAKVDNDAEPSFICSDGSISISSDESNEYDDDDDESVLCFDGCGCWELDNDHKGDLYLSDNSDFKWPAIRLPMPLYNKLFQHQRIGVQWMASLYRNKIKGGILGKLVALL